MGIVDDLTARADQLSVDRLHWEKAWRQVADVCLPMHQRIREGTATNALDRLLKGPNATERGKMLYDSTAVWAVDRLAAGMESLVTPAAEKWHGLEIDDPLAPEMTQEESEWFETLRDFQFAARYDARSGFQTANQQAIRSVVSLGTAVIFTEEAFEAKGRSSAALPWLYRNIPVNECYLAVDKQGEVDTNFRRFWMTARQMVQRWGDGVSSRVKAAAEDPKGKDEEFEILHAVMPREERGSSRGGNRESAFASFYVELDTRQMVGESGYFEFPFAVYHWVQPEGSAYGESPVMLALADIHTLQAMAKSGLQAFQQWIKPPLAVANDGVMNRPNLNSGAINYGAVDANGRQKIQPIVTMQRPDFAEQVMETRRNAVRESLYITLFQTLIQNPSMTATEAMLRANEKGELLGPAGGKIQAALARVVERELGIIERKGAYEPGSQLMPPESLAGRSFGVKFTSPLDRVRRAQDGVGIQRTIEAAAPLAQVDPSIMDNFDSDEIVRAMREINGAPSKILRRPEEVEALRQQRAQAAQEQQQMQQLQQVAGAARDAAPAMSEALNVAGELGVELPGRA